jgi:hypothetical protein
LAGGSGNINQLKAILKNSFSIPVLSGFSENIPGRLKIFFRKDENAREGWTETVRL